MSVSPSGNFGSVWDHFTQTSGGRGTGLVKTAVCKHCPKSFTLNKGSTSGLRYHLKSDHPSLYSAMLVASTAEKRKRREVQEAVQAAEDDAVAEAFSTPRKTPRRNLLEDAEESPQGMDRFRKYASGDKRQLKFDMALTKLLATLPLPFNLVETEQFQEFIATICPRVTVKSETTFRKSKLPRLYDQMKAQLDKKLSEDMAGCAGVAFSTDLWTSRAAHPFLSLTLHYLGNAWEWKKFAWNCLPFFGHHTAVRIAQALDGEVEQIPLQSGTNMVVVHDAAANMKAAIRKCTKPMTSFVCMDHRLQTCLRKAFADEDAKPIDAILKKATDLASLMHRSPTACQLVQAECEALGVSYVKVITPVATRWNSRYLMVQSINTIGPALSSLNEKNSNLGTDLFTDDQLQLLKVVEKVLSKFEEATRTFSIDKSPSMPEVIPTIVNLKGYVTRWLQNPPDFAIQGLCEALKRQLDNAWPDCATSEREPAMAHFFHPHYRGVLLKHYGAYDSLVEDLVDSHPSTEAFRNRTPQSETPTQPRPESQSVDLFEDDMDISPAELLTREFFRSGQEVTEEKAPMEIEISSYLAMVRPKRSDVDILKWWNENEQVLPLLSREARKFLCIPASSTSSERMFSAAGNIVTAKRYNLDPKTTQRLLFCQQNWKALKVRGWSIEAEMAENPSASNLNEPQPGPSGLSSAPPSGYDLDSDED
jgi:hypothetical protein